MPSNPALFEAIAHRINTSAHHRIPFAEFMDLVLYHPEHGYYITGTALGPGGDFVTAPHLGHDFGELLGEQFAQMWQYLGQPRPFTLLEMGAGQGLVAADVLSHLERHHPECLAPLQYKIVEISGGLQKTQRQRLAAWGDRIEWVGWDAIAANSVIGCCFSNELVDALPVHQVVVTEAGLQEVYVTLGETGEAELRETLGPFSTPRIQEYFQDIGIHLSPPGYPVGYRTEVNLAALDWLSTVADRLQRGYVVTIDYGYATQRYYAPSRRQGTLQCYYRHGHHDDPYQYLGQQDITAHVNFTALERQGEQCGLTREGFTPQGLFLMALGLGDRIAAISETEAADTSALQQLLRRREALHQLINPLGMGNFGVLIQHKGMAAAPPLQGLMEPAPRPVPRR
ncbi:hypothetical protein XM38_037680 [Halomicronema hongdechloris C2206]|uniref:Class I SAM-dependent methyltransferase n=1 Tax=Halomicronema hongdechloris C2206 TaxID=1641165 RepID=A0A1Z3HR59_9CYAN|nr:class I SAM-dependent methyltransferase [Halomicronema hongdechloris]ASC72809.1 hypothetical protein XM38_037680 [Halomicronema hongdechloris C2206]